jgi:hypothetical protein
MPHWRGCGSSAPRASSEFEDTDAIKTPPKRLLVPAAVALLAVMGLAAGWWLLRQPPLPEGLIQANGRI